jgi:predicted nucleic acid-binding protein
MSGKIPDSNAVINFFNGVAGAERLTDMLDDAERYVSVITRMELLSFPRLTPAVEQGTLRFLADCTIIPLDQDIEESAIMLRRKNRIKLPDAIIAATALLLDATLITNDDALLRLNGHGLNVVKLL